MNMNADIVNRAVLATGQSPISQADIDAKNSSYELCKTFYISAFLEALSEVEWVASRKREKLVRTGRPVNKDMKYAYAYDMPFDCARPVELQENEFFLVEDRLILTDVPDAELLYVSNGKVLRPINTAAAGKPGGIHEMEYFTAGSPGTECEEILYPGLVEFITDELPEDPPPETDYPDYTALNYEPKFYEYIEKKLAAKFTMKLSDNMQLHTQMLQEALLVKQEAVDASRASRSAKIKENKWWSETLGLGTGI